MAKLVNPLAKGMNKSMTRYLGHFAKPKNMSRGHNDGPDYHIIQTPEHDKYPAVPAQAGGISTVRIPPITPVYPQGFQANDNNRIYRIK